MDKVLALTACVLACVATTPLRWNRQPRKLTPGQALLALMDNTVAARRNPGHSMPILKQAVTRAITLKSKRGEAGDIAPLLLSRLEKSI